VAETDLTKPGVDDSAPDVELRDDTGKQINLSVLWQERPLALLFVRHFG
jgi:peroxiredoxin